MITVNLIVILFVFRISLTSDKSLLYKKQNIFELHFTRCTVQAFIRHVSPIPGF